MSAIQKARQAAQAVQSKYEASVSVTLFNGEVYLTLAKDVGLDADLEGSADWIEQVDETGSRTVLKNRDQPLPSERFGRKIRLDPELQRLFDELEKALQRDALPGTDPVLPGPLALAWIEYKRNVKEPQDVLDRVLGYLP